jgi:PadR family transcriptional regulator PadR
MTKEKTDLLQGTLDLLILKALHLQPMHGYGLSVRLRQMSGEIFQVEMGSLYPALCRLEAQGLVHTKWGLSENNRKARFYSLMPSGRRQLEAETGRWETLSNAINAILRAT